MARTEGCSHSCLTAVLVQKPHLTTWSDASTQGVSPNAGTTVGYINNLLVTRKERVLVFALMTQ